MEETIEFALPNEMIEVKFVPRKKGMAANVEDNHVISGGMLTNSVETLRCPLQERGGLKNLLTKEEKSFLEQATGLNLSVYGDFWKTFAVRLYKDSAANKFDLSDPMGYLSYKILEAYSQYNVAPSWKERHASPEYQFAIVRDGEIQSDKKSKFDVKKEAFKAYGRIEDDKEKVVAILRLLTNKPISSDSKLSWLQGQVEEKLDSNPKGFLDVINDSNFETKGLIFDAVEKGIIKKNGNKYATVDGLELCESGNIPTFDAAVRYLNDPKNQEVRDLIIARIDTAK